MPARFAYLPVLLAALLIPVAWPAAADDLKAEVITRCINDAGEWGTEMVKRCVEGDLAAANALQAYPQEHRAIVDRCTRRYQRYGWEMVKLCADRDIEAEAALAQYPRDTEDHVAACRDLTGKRGAAKVKECVDKRIGGEQSPGTQ
jgi:hypothetical protein